VGPTISARQRDAVRSRLVEASALGLKVLDLGPWSLPANGFYLEPTVFLDVDPKVRIAQEEVFGPVVTVTTFIDDDEAIALANGTRYGLATTVWTGSFQRSRRVAREVLSGLVWINNVHSLHPGSPYGGYKQSGVGLEMGQEAIQQHMKVKSIWVDDGSWQSPWS
jgi:acyl-CoA reductase-like NAD-dependent aldehyde dehydrogenase